MTDRQPPAAASLPTPDDRWDATEERAALLTAYALGQLDAADRSAVERLLADPDARRVVEETRAVAETLRATRRLDAAPPSTDLRRAVVAAIARATEPLPGEVADRNPDTVSGTPRARRRLGWLTLTGALAASLLVGLVATRESPSILSDREVVLPRSSQTGQPAAKRTVATDGLSTQLERRAEDIAGSGLAADANGVAQARAGVELAEKAATAPGPGRRNAADIATSAPPAPALDLALAMPATAERQRGLTRDGADADRFARKAAAAVDRLDALGDEAREPGEREQLGVARPADGRGDMPSGERYATFFENRFRSTADAPLSTFSIDVDTASYALVRRFLSAGQLPPPDAVRLEELLNYFSYDDPAPAGDDPFSVTIEAATCPWRPGHRLVRVGLRGRDVPRTERPAGNLVFLVDVSGSMADDDKLPLIKQGLTMLVQELDENDRVAIVTYAGDAGLRLPSTSGAEKGAILAAIESLTSGGGTHGSAGIELAYAQAAEHFVRGGVNRVILATDGDLNVGITDDRALATLITAKAAGGTFLTVLGVGRGNLQDEKLETIAAHGNGIYAYLDGAREARKVLVEQLTGSTITIAKDVKIQVEFNPAVVASWRQLGYENRLMAARDFRDDTKDAGDIGAGHAVTALYEVALVGEADDQSGGEPLKYAAPKEPRDAPVLAASRDLLTVKLRFKRPDGNTSTLREVPLAERGGDFTAASADLRFAAAVAGFGMLLRDSEHAGDATYGWVAATASKALGTDAGGWRTEFLDLVRRAESLAPRVGPPGVTPLPRPASPAR